jgi:hypothetical protein
VLAFGAKGTDIPRALVNETVTDHFVLSLEAPPALTSAA